MRITYKLGKKPKIGEISTLVFIKKKKKKKKNDAFFFPAEKRNYFSVLGPWGLEQ